MAISFRCPCGQPLEVDEIYAGKRAQCPACNAVVAVPGPAAAPRIAKHATLVPPPPSSLDPRSSRKDEDDPDRKFRRRYSDVDEEDEDGEDRPRRRRVTERTHKFWNNSVRGGLIAMVIAVVWLVVGLLFGVFFIYPLILFVIGLIGFIAGLVTGRDS